MRKVATWLLAVVLLAVLAFLTLGASFVDRRMNTVILKPPYRVSPAAQALHAKLRVADMHDDLLLWPRDPVARGTVGSTDIPRLLDGNIAVEIFSTVSKTPRGQNYESNAGNSDNITALAIAEHRPIKTWTSLLERARWTSLKAHDAAERANGSLILVTTASELARELAGREVKKNVVIGLLSVEGLQVLEGKLENLKTLYSLGFRMAGLAHFFDNDVAGSAHGIAKGGLTPFGREVVKKMEEKGIIVDLAHVSSKTVDDVLAMATRPVVVSHGGVAAVCPGPRNWTDDQLRRLASNGGVIGIGFWDAAICDATPAGVAKAIRHAVDVAGVDHVGLGSDWDGAINAAFDATGMPLVTEALLAQGFSEDDIAKIMGENVIRILLQGLPKG
ncbi:MAG: dipeptidase [Gemmatimonadetes bacterium]|nr:dipeptidase [Gemmatimonadota bacterium]MBI3566844.1 dipeptidase [Gemmatimonadota bacterium]